MTRAITLIIAALAFVGCQEGSGLEQAPADQHAAPGEQLAVVDAKCADLAEQFKALSEQIAKLRLQLAIAAKMIAEAEAEQPVRKDFESDESFAAAFATHQAKVVPAKHNVANLDAHFKSLVEQDKALRDKAANAGCKEIPPPKPSGDSTSVRGGAVSAKPLGMLPSVGSGEPTPTTLTPEQQAAKLKQTGAASGDGSDDD
ncbi:MAG: hypothetical protein JRF63_01070 [Deltaproteobacteria bacterium]|nr:hypothetical protein [Deltaproteobacteria bacterium]